MAVISNHQNHQRCQQQLYVMRFSFVLPHQKGWLRDCLHCCSLWEFCPSSAPTCIVLFFYLLFTRFWLISVLYSVWWFVDYDTPSRGGRRVPFLCGLKVWEHMRDYFPIKVRRQPLEMCCP